MKSVPLVSESTPALPNHLDTYRDALDRDVAAINATSVVDVIDGERLQTESPVRDIYEAFARFLLIDVANGDATADTIKAYHREVSYWMDWCCRRQVDPVAARRSHIEAYRAELKAAGLSVSTRSHKLSIIRRFYDAGVKHGVLKTNPAEGVKGGKDLTPPEEKIRALTEGALAALLNTVPHDVVSGQRDRLILGLMGLQGLRSVEVWRLDHADAVLEGDQALLRVHGKGHKIRTLPLRADVWRAWQDYTAAKLKAGLSASGPVIVGHGNHGRGQRISRRSLENVVNKYMEQAGLKRDGVSCHGLRHTFATVALHNGAKIEYVRDEMGHHLVDTTMTYVRLLQKRENSAASFIGVELHFEESAQEPEQELVQRQEQLL